MLVGAASRPTTRRARRSVAVLAVVVTVAACGGGEEARELDFAIAVPAPSFEPGDTSQVTVDTAEPVLWGVSASGATATLPPPIYPLEVSEDGRYLVDSDRSSVAGAGRRRLDDVVRGDHRGGRGVPDDAHVRRASTRSTSTPWSILAATRTLTIPPATRPVTHPSPSRTTSRALVHHRSPSGTGSGSTRSSRRPRSTTWR